MAALTRANHQQLSGGFKTAGIGIALALSLLAPQAHADNVTWSWSYTNDTLDLSVSNAVYGTFTNSSTSTLPIYIDSPNAADGGPDLRIALLLKDASGTWVGALQMVYTHATLLPGESITLKLFEANMMDSANYPTTVISGIAWDVLIGTNCITSAGTVASTCGISLQLPTNSVTILASAVPEPETASLMLMGTLVGGAAYRRRLKASS